MMKLAQLRILVSTTFVALFFLGCPSPSDSPSSQPSADQTTVNSADYLNMVPGASIRYTITYPAHYTEVKPTEVSCTFQSNNSDAGKKHLYITGLDGRFSSAEIQMDASGVVYKGGYTRVPGSILFQKLNLPARVSASENTVWQVTSTWHGAGAYTIKPISSFTAGDTQYKDCLRIDFPSSKLCYTGQKGNGYYILARNVGVVHYEAVLDESGSLGNAGEKIIYSALTAKTINARRLTMRILDKVGIVQQGAMVDFNNGQGPALTAGTDGSLDIPVYLPENDSLGTFHAYVSVTNGRGDYPMEVTLPANPEGNINLGDITFLLPEFSQATVTLTPASGSTGVDPSITKISAVFSLAMLDGYSWCSVSGGEFPESGGSPKWNSSTEIEMPVSLQPGRTYTLSLNSTYYTSFRDTSGNPIMPIEWTFTTSAE